MHRGFALVSQLFVVIFVLVACNAVTPTPSPTPQATSTPAPRTFLMQQVSMLPTIQEGELLLIEEVPIAQLQRSDIIVFRVPGGKVVHVKRLIGLPGEAVEVRDGKVFINGNLLEEPYIMNPGGPESPYSYFGSQ